jgi:hypothetical protein
MYYDYQPHVFYSCDWQVFSIVNLAIFNTCLGGSVFPCEYSLKTANSSDTLLLPSHIKKDLFRLAREIVANALINLILFSAYHLVALELHLRKWSIILATAAREIVVAAVGLCQSRERDTHHLVVLL